MVSATQDPWTLARPWEASASRKIEPTGESKTISLKGKKRSFVCTQYFLWTYSGMLAKLIGIFVQLVFEKEFYVLESNSKEKHARLR